MKCDVSGEWIGPGDYYYQDDTDGMKVKATVYRALKDMKKEKEWDYTKINMASNELEYRTMLQQATQQMLTETVLERKVAGKYDPNPNTETQITQEIYDDADENNVFETSIYNDLNNKPYK
jgi:hypothetical protein